MTALPWRHLAAALLLSIAAAAQALPVRHQLQIDWTDGVLAGQQDRALFDFDATDPEAPVHWLTDSFELDSVYSPFLPQVGPGGALLSATFCNVTFGGTGCYLMAADGTTSVIADVLLGGTGSILLQQPVYGGPVYPFDVESARGTVLMSVVAEVPEPGAWALMALGLAGLAWRARRP